MKTEVPLARETLTAAMANGLAPKWCFFWGHTPSQDGSVTKSCFSQWWAGHPFTIDGVEYATAEHWMMAGKARLFRDEEMCAEILAAVHPNEAKKLGRKVRGFDDKQWRTARWDIVVRGNAAKFGQHPALREFLLNTGDRIIVEASPYDQIWGIGMAATAHDAENPAQWRGLNLLGFALMAVREELSKINMNSILNLTLRQYAEQLPEWPKSGRHIMAQFDADSIIVYQAYRPAIALYAVANQRFGGEFSYTRMSWIKPNFLWMMFRSGWAAKEGQEHILAIRLKRPFFDELLTAAVASTFNASGMDNYDAWQNAIARSDVRLQWDPDHDPKGNCVERRAVQLGLRGGMLQRFGEEELLSIEDITPFATEQHAVLNGSPKDLVIPLEQIYTPSHPQAAANVGLDTLNGIQS